MSNVKIIGSKEDTETITVHQVRVEYNILIDDCEYNVPIYYDCSDEDLVAKDTIISKFYRADFSDITEELIPDVLSVIKADLLRQGLPNRPILNQGE